MEKHYNLSEKLIPGAIIIDENRCFYSDYYTTAEHERQLNLIADNWIIYEDRDETITADTDGGCDRIVEATYTHELKLSDAIFFKGQIVGFYLDFQSWNGSNEKPNSHIFLLDDTATHIYNNTHSIWRLMKKES